MSSPATASTPRSRRLRLGSVIASGLWLAACGDNPSSPNSEGSDPELALAVSTGLQFRQELLLLKWDGAVRVFLRARCPVGYHVIEGPVTVAQTPESQEVFGEGFFTTTCDGRWHRLSVRVAPPEGRFTEGDARVSASLMVENDVGDFQQGDVGGILPVVR